jgi:tetratricopeptide (TPR) repeat protein
MKKKRAYLIVIFLIIACCIAFGRIVGNDFINLDDPGYITENYHVQSGISLKNIQWAFTTVVLNNWHPLTMISHMLDWSLFGANASGHHLVSLLLHIGAVIFLFLFLNKTTNSLWPSAFAAALFALHPLRVESVAWAAERKDVLSMFFGMAALYAYAFYAESSKYSRYFICLILFTLSLMSKPMLVTLPFVLLLLDYWPLGRWQKVLSIPIENRYQFAGKLVWEKAPFFIFTTLSIGLTLWSQRTGIASLDRLPIVDRAINAILSYLYYIDKFVYPVDLAVFYPYPNYVSLWQVCVAALLLLGISIAVIYTFKKAPFLFVGWFWYLGTMIPVIGLVQVGHQAMADRYTYLPSIGIAIMLAWGVPLLFRSEDTHRKVLFPVVSAVIVTIVFLSWMQCGYWENSISLFSHTLNVTKNNYSIHNNIALPLSKEGKINEAIYHYNEAIRLNPNYAEAYNNRGTLYGKIRQYQLAIKDFNKAINLYPNYAEAHYNKGLTYFMSGQYQSAIKYYNKAITLKSDYADAYSNRAVAYFKKGDRNLGCLDAQKACELGNCKILKSAKDKGYCR